MTEWYGEKGRNVAGSVEITQGAGVVPSTVLTWDLSGLDPECTERHTGSGKQCGIHILAAESCSEGGHGSLYRGKEDPWRAVQYQANPSGLSKSMTGGAEVVTNLTFAELLGKVIVAYDSVGAGRRIACAVIPAGPQSAASASTTPPNSNATPAGTTAPPNSKSTTTHPVGVVSSGAGRQVQLSIISFVLAACQVLIFSVAPQCGR